MFSKRSDEKELMDDLLAGGEEMQQTLLELERVNRFLGGYSTSLKGIERILKINLKKEFTLVDAGCGGGDVLREIRNWSLEKGVNAKLTGVDANPNIVSMAKDDKRNKGIDFLEMDIFSDNFREMEFDIIHSCLFCHHFSDDELVEMLSGFKKQARMGVVINDLHRHPLAYYSIKYITRFFSSSEMVKHDAPISVLRAFKEEELKRVFSLAGFTNFEIDWEWAFRYRCVLYPS